MFISFMKIFSISFDSSRLHGALEHLTPTYDVDFFLGVNSSLEAATPIPVLYNKKM